MSHTETESGSRETMMSPMDFTGMCHDFAALVQGVMRTNPRAMRECFARITLKPSPTGDTGLPSNPWRRFCMAS